MTDPDDSAVLAATRTWLERAVIGLNLCPFARAPLVRGRLRMAVSRATDEDALLGDLDAELALLRDADPERVETTLLIHPCVLRDFEAYNAFLDIADLAVRMQGLEGVVQVASFHPDYRFADAAPDAIENHSNRSPHPILHLLRESSVDAAVAAVPDTDAIYERNIQTLRRLGHAGWDALWDGPADDGR
ncbi:DUF1415 domain-containing protein [Coralloluteibacterium stylophorae]|uniref:DUF1415 domain-containing protein n=1 Tax=Coralloluteibacterium stylophorae TaxID=1776034 RepID=A0A8J7VUC8_9GAMM|nr:DUF1415 domain-containing protein [Coralloluteibacterium stylophorae]